MRTDDITPTWIDRVVSDFGRHILAPCLDVTIDPIPNERVQVHRLQLRYAPGPGSRPPSLILKTPVGPALPEGDRSRHDAGACEAYFFRRLAGSSGLWTPGCYAVDYDETQNTSILLVEDLANLGLRQGNRVSGIQKTEAEIILRQIAAFHSRYWDRTQEPALRELESLTETRTTTGDAAIRGYYEKAWPAVVACGLYDIPPDVARLGNVLLGDPNWARHRLAQGPQTIVHGDVHVENMFFDDRSDPVRVALIDWEDVATGNGLTDVAWLMTTSVDTHDVDWEVDLIRSYHEALMAGGIRDYGWSECLADYRLAIESVFVQGVLNCGTDLAGSEAELTAERELGQRYMLACQRGRTWELR